MYLHMVNIVHTAFSYERELIICLFLQDFSKGKGSSVQLICNAHNCVFTLYGRAVWRQQIISHPEVKMSKMHCKPDQREDYLYNKFSDEKLYL